MICTQTPGSYLAHLIHALQQLVFFWGLDSVARGVSLGTLKQVHTGRWSSFLFYLEPILSLNPRTSTLRQKEFQPSTGGLF